MGMMTRRNVRARVAVKAAPAKAEVKAPVDKKPVVDFEEAVKAKGLSKTEINRMTTSELQELAKELNVEDAEETSGSQIKKMLIGALGD